MVSHLAIVVTRWKDRWSELRRLKLIYRLRSRQKSVWLVFLMAISIVMSVAIAVVARPTNISPAVLGTSLNRAAIAQLSKPDADPDFPLKVHPLPPALAAWTASQAGDYFDQIETVPVGYLVWSQFPVRVYVQPPTPTELASPFTAQRSQTWIKAVNQAVQEWHRYLPLTLVTQADKADIVVLRSPPPLTFEVSPDPKQESASGQSQREPRPTLQLGRVRSAVTSYKVYVKGSLEDAASKPMLAHRCTIQLRPDQASLYLRAAARHELGHALGLWGHSQAQTDVMYFSQVREPPPLSPRDLNTLKRVYEQPTRLGWALVE
ncbi:MULTISPECIES: matrixin family metalloprotease [Cyanophyceae]|uniref:Peptidase metallopeptidase domain-containing protein n=1 Tax=Stenomitos frigidus AS-A4 TaxID=2933935 RepID=A0ABV0KN61_9CYAN|nr:matrixin family metalloprotease [Phormidium sp. FACHB-592]